MSDTHEEMPWRRKHRVMPICTDEGNGLTHSEMASVVSSSAPSGKPSMGAEEPSMPAPSGEGMPEWDREPEVLTRAETARELDAACTEIRRLRSEIARLTREKDEAVQAEREACARLVEGAHERWVQLRETTCDLIAEEIRARASSPPGATT